MDAEEQSLDEPGEHAGRDKTSQNPQRATAAPWRSTRARMPRGVAPSAMRMPISRVPCDTR